MKDFFISYNQKDRAWALWIAQQLESVGYSTIIQAADMPPGSNFVLEMHRAAAEAARTIAVLSPDFLQSQFTQPEWAAAFAKDPASANRTLLPVRVRECQPAGLLAQIVYIDFVGKTREEARHLLLAGLDHERKRLSLPARFPMDEVRQHDCQNLSINEPLPKTIGQSDIQKDLDAPQIKVGPNIVAAWFRQVVNPLLWSLRAEVDLLQRHKWTWRQFRCELEHIKPIWVLVASYQDSLVEFLRLHPNFAVLVEQYHEERVKLIKACDSLQQLLEPNKKLSSLYEQAKADCSISHTGEPINQILLNGSDVEHKKFLAQYIVNRADEIFTGEVYKDVWNKYRNELLELLKTPEIIREHQQVVESGIALLRCVDELINSLIEIRRTLHLQYDVPLEN
jgi:hypothetical protein